jgi:hypothetical protein
MKSGSILVKSAFAAMLAVGLAAAAPAGKAEARHHWIGPALVGAVVGGAIVHHLHKHRHHRHYAYHPVPVRKVHRVYRPRVVYVYPAPVYVPVIGIGFHRHW